MTGALQRDVQTLRAFLAGGGVCVLTGAGVSTGSGIPDYRDRDGAWKHAQPMQFQEFAASRSARQRYWARSYVGWHKFGAARPNAAHHALADLESAGRVDTIITQNVDRLHSRAGSRRVIDLHGNLGIVVCLDCGHRDTRENFQASIRQVNGHWHAEVFRIKPDGDAELAAESYADFVVPDCTSCGGMLKPDVVMFGESVPRIRVDEAMDSVERARSLLVIGSSLMVFSGYRFVRRAAERGKPVAVLNQGKTRADDIATVRIDADCREILGRAVAPRGTACGAGSRVQ